MWFMKKRGEGRLQKESQEAEPEAPFGFTSLLLLAVSLFAIAYIVAFGFHPGEWRAYVKDLLFAIGTALLVTWGFTRLVEIPHVAKYMARKLAEVMFGERYLRSIRSSLPDLRGRIDRVLYGEAALGYPWSLYNFVNTQVHEFYASSFRRNFVVEVKCERLANGKKMRWREKSAFLYVRNNEDKQVPKIKLYRKADFTEEVAAELSEEEKKRVFNSNVIGLEVRVGRLVFKAPPDDRTRLVQDGGAQAEIKVDWRIGRSYLEYECEYAIPADLLGGREAREVRVETVEEFVERSRDDVYYVGVTHPTEDFSLVCDFPDDVRLELLKFSMADPSAEPPIPDIPTWGHGMISIDGWLLPGHGGCVAWYGMATEAPAGPGAERKEAGKAAAPAHT